MLNKTSRELIAYFMKAYPARTAAMVFLLMVSGLAEGLGFFSLLPALEFVAGGGTAEPSQVTQAFTVVLDRLGISVTMGSMLLFVSVSIAFKSVFLWLAMQQVGYTVSHVATGLRLRLIRGLMQASWGHFTRQPTGFLASAVSQEAHRASWAYRAACEAAGGVMRIVAYLIVAFLFSWQVSVAAIFVAGSVLFLFKNFVSMGRDAGTRQVEVLRTLTKSLTEALPGIKPIKAMGRERFLLPILERDAEAMNDAQKLEVLASESLKALREPVIVSTVCAGLYAVVTFANQPFASMMVLVLLFYRIVGTVNVLQINAQAIATGEEAFRSIRDHIELAEENQESKVGDKRPPPLHEAIEFKDVSFRHGDTTILDSVSFTIPAKRFTAFIGPSGAGKTTLIDIIARLHEPSDGHVEIDGVRLDELETAQWRSRIGYVPQDVALFHGSIYDNVTLGDDRVDRDDVVRALQDAGAWDFVSAHPDGLDRVVGEGGSMISGGQRQRILMARALVASPSLLLLDEATTALDPATEALLCSKLQELSGKVTIVAVSHQAALRDAADLVFEVGGGRVTKAREEHSRVAP